MKLKTVANRGKGGVVTTLWMDHRELEAVV